MLSRTAKSLRTVKIYDFADQDPIIDYTRKMVFGGGGPSKVAKASGVASSTLHKWYTKKGRRTRRPQFATVANVLLACGETTLDLKKLRSK